MTDLLNILTGVAIAVLAQIGTRFILDPLQAYQLMRSSISYDLVFFAPIWSNPGVSKEHLMEEAQTKLRADAMQLRTQPHPILLHISSVAQIPRHRRC